MKRWWETQFARVNGLTLRDRVFLFLSVIVCSVALVDAVWLSPARVVNKQLSQRSDKLNVDLQRARDELKTVAKPESGAIVVRDELAAVKIKLETVNQKINEVLPVATEVTPLVQVLVHFLSRHESLTFVRTTVAEPEVALAKAAVPGAKTSASAPSMGLTRQSVELTVSGPYPELVRYVQTLEKALPHVRWGAMKLKSEKLPPELTLQLFLIGVQP